MPEPEPAAQPQPATPAPAASPYVASTAIAGAAAVVGLVIANIEKLQPFLDKNGMMGLVILTGLGLVVFASWKIVPLIERAIESSWRNGEKLSENYQQQTVILNRMDERQEVDSSKLHELHQEIVIKGRPVA